MNLGSSCYTGDLRREARGKEITACNTDPQVVAFIGSYFIGSFGLNLHYMAHHHILFDAPPNQGSKLQARGRDRRFGQEHDVKELEVEGQDNRALIL